MVRVPGPQTLTGAVVSCFRLGLFSLAISGCGGSGATQTAPEPVSLRIGFGLTPGNSPEIGVQQAATFLVMEGLVAIRQDGRAEPILAEGWSVSDDGLTWRIPLRRAATFHDGTPLRADVVRLALMKGLPQTMGPAFDDIREIRVADSKTVDVLLKRRSGFLLEGLELFIEGPSASLLGTGPFIAAKQGSQIVMRANDRYYGGRPAVDRVEIRPYTSVRAAWADLLRGQVDVLYDVGVDALDSLETSRDVKVFRFPRGYAFMVLLNLRKRSLQDPALRRALNDAIDRDALVSEIFRSHGTPATGPVWPQNWAYDSSLPRLSYRPHLINVSRGRLRLKCIFGDASHERLAIAVQRQLQAIGVDLELEMLSGSQLFSRLQSGDFDAILIDVIQGPNLAPPYLVWHSRGPFNWEHYANAQVDAALDSIRHAADDGEYRSGVAAFQRAIVDDPPAVFLVWGERARAVSRRFTVPDRPGSDVLSAIRLWRPVDDRIARRN